MFNKWFFFFNIYKMVIVEYKLIFSLYYKLDNVGDLIIKYLVRYYNDRRLSNSLNISNEVLNLIKNYLVCVFIFLKDDLLKC